MTLRQCRPAEAEALLGLIGEYYAYDHIDLEPCAQDAVRTLLADSSIGRAWFIEIDGQVAGYAVLTAGFDHEIGGRLGVLTDFFLREPFRGKGYGPQALAEIERLAKADGMLFLELVVQPDNERARRMYERAGFEKSPRTTFTKPLS